ncbi:hypothetical protein B0H10DRAFT_1952405 [Mycena sp. CBHHK59/15]|nr:hypothetical protein B0H10DRAFT_1952405 [Mycena sp. CBHHK59/15]
MPLPLENPPPSARLSVLGATHLPRRVHLGHNGRNNASLENWRAREILYLARLRRADYPATCAAAVGFGVRVDELLSRFFSPRKRAADHLGADRPWELNRSVLLTSSCALSAPRPAQHLSRPVLVLCSSRDPRNPIAHAACTKHRERGAVPHSNRRIDLRSPVRVGIELRGPTQMAGGAPGTRRGARTERLPRAPQFSRLAVSRQWQRYVRRGRCGVPSADLRGGFGAGTRPGCDEHMGGQAYALSHDVSSTRVVWLLVILGADPGRGLGHQASPAPLQFARRAKAIRHNRVGVEADGRPSAFCILTQRELQCRRIFGEILAGRVKGAARHLVQQQVLRASGSRRRPHGIGNPVSHSASPELLDAVARSIHLHGQNGAPRRHTDLEPELGCPPEEHHLVPQIDLGRRREPSAGQQPQRWMICADACVRPGEQPLDSTEDYKADRRRTRARQSSTRRWWYAGSGYDDTPASEPTIPDTGACNLQETLTRLQRTLHGISSTLASAARQGRMFACSIASLGERVNAMDAQLVGAGYARMQETGTQPPWVGGAGRPTGGRQGGGGVGEDGGGAGAVVARRDAVVAGGGGPDDGAPPVTREAAEGIGGRRACKY